jgi:hypothetical protein
MQQTGEHDAHAHAQQQVAGDAPLLMFAYGSMCNPVSLNRRQLFPSASTPAVLQGYRLAFELSGGMANIVREEGGVTHGVLHTVTRAEFDVLKGIELHYATIEVRVTPYSSRSGSGAAAGGGSSAAPAETVTAAAFIVQREALDAMKAQHPEWLADPLPSDRYLRIISAGLTHYGADPAWVAALAALPCKPSRPPHEYYKAAVAVAEGGPGPQLPTFSAAQLAAAGQAFREGASTKAVFGLGPKVLQVDVPGKQDAPIAQTFMRQHFAGHDAAYAVCMMLQVRRCPDWGACVSRAPCVLGCAAHLRTRVHCHCCCLLHPGATAAAPQQPTRSTHRARGVG